MSELTYFRTEPFQSGAKQHLTLFFRGDLWIIFYFIFEKFSKLYEIVTLRSRVKLIRVTKVVLRKINVTGEKITSRKAPKEKRNKKIGWPRSRKPCKIIICLKELKEFGQGMLFFITLESFVLFPDFCPFFLFSSIIWIFVHFLDFIFIYRSHLF